MAKSLQEIQDMLTDKWSNNACRGYVIKAMESCGYKSKDIREILIELYERLQPQVGRRAYHGEPQR